MKEKSKKTHAGPSGPGAAVAETLPVAPPTSEPIADDPEPTAGSASVPVWMIVVLGVGLFGTQLYLDRNGGEFNGQVYERFATVKDVDDHQVKSEDQLALIRGQNLFAGNCAVCHQMTGLGLPPQFPPLAGSEWVQAPTPERIVRVVLNGLGGPIQVKGQQFNFQMTPFRGTSLTDADIASILSYVRQAWGNGASAVSAEQVGAIRDLTKDRQDPWTSEELLQVPLAQ